METKDLVYIALFAAFMGVLGLFPPMVLPVLAVPITLQSFGPMLAGALIGAKRAAFAMMLFCLLVLLGSPLLSGARGGIAPFIGPSAGFIYGWVICAWVIGYGFEKLSDEASLLSQGLVILLGGIMVLYLFGTLWLAWIAQLTLSQAFYTVLIFLPGDLVKAGFALVMARRIKRVVVI